MAEELKQLRTALEAAMQGAGNDELAFHPEGKWCSAEVLEHLSRSYFGTSFVMKKSLAEGAPTTPRSVRDRVAQLLVTTLGYFPQGRKAPAPTVPKGVPPEQAVREIRANFDEMEKALAAAEEKFGAKTVVGLHPVRGPLTAGQWRRFHLAHGLHHCKQVDALRRQWRAQRTTGDGM